MTIFKTLAGKLEIVTLVSSSPLPPFFRRFLIALELFICFCSPIDFHFFVLSVFLLWIFFIFSLSFYQVGIMSYRKIRKLQSTSVNTKQEFVYQLKRTIHYKSEYRNSATNIPNIIRNKNKKIESMRLHFCRMYSSKSGKSLSSLESLSL